MILPDSFKVRITVHYTVFPEARVVVGWSILYNNNIIAFIYPDIISIRSYRKVTYYTSDLDPHVYTSIRPNRGSPLPSAEIGNHKKWRGLLYMSVCYCIISSIVIKLCVLRR